MSKRTPRQRLKIDFTYGDTKMLAKIKSQGEKPRMNFLASSPEFFVVFLLKPSKGLPFQILLSCLVCFSLFKNMGSKT